MNHAFPVLKIFEFDPKNVAANIAIQFSTHHLWSGTCCHKSVSIVTSRQAGTGGRQWDTMCSVVTRGDNAALSPECMWLSPHRQAQCLKTYSTSTYTYTHTHTDLWWNWLCRRTEAPTLPPWWGRPIRARATEHRLPVRGEHLLPPPTHKHAIIKKGLHTRKYDSTKKQVSISLSVCRAQTGV